MRAFRVAVYGMLPPLGLALGPAAVVLGALALWRGKADPAALLALTSWLGAVLMIVGWRA
jgi:hypothetical protein